MSNELQTWQEVQNNFHDALEDAFGDKDNETVSAEYFHQIIDDSVPIYHADILNVVQTANGGIMRREPGVEANNPNDMLQACIYEELREIGWSWLDEHNLETN